MLFADRKHAADRQAVALQAYKGRNPLILAVPRGAFPHRRGLAGEERLVHLQVHGLDEDRVRGDAVPLLQDEEIAAHDLATRDAPPRCTADDECARARQVPERGEGSRRLALLHERDADHHGDGREEELDCDALVEGEMPCRDDDAHPALTEDALDLVLAEEDVSRLRGECVQRTSGLARVME